MSVEQPIFPAYGTGQLIATNTTAVAVTNLPKDSKQLMLTAIGQNCYVRVTDSADTSNATVADLLINTTNFRLISKGELTRLSVVSPGGAGQLHVIGCDGATGM